MARIEILHVRDPDCQCGMSVWVDGVLVGADVEDVDPGAGYEGEDWDERLAEAASDTTRSPAFAAAVLQSLRAYSDNQYIERHDRQPPYLVTVERLGKPYAVGSLEEARDRVVGLLPEEHRIGAKAREALVNDAQWGLNFEGGSIGPFPDGTSVEVQRTSYPDLIAAMVERGDDTADIPEGDEDAIINAFNGEPVE